MIETWTVPGGIHLDIGSDHGGLLRRLLIDGHVQQGIAVEVNLTPYQNSLRALKHHNADVRLGNGLTVIAAGEMQSLSIAGMGGRTMTKILDAHPERVCPWLFLQPNKDWARVRRWAYESHFHLVQENLTPRLFVLLAFRMENSRDPIYNNLPLEAAFEFGPRLLGAADAILKSRLLEEREYFRPLANLNPEAANRLRLIEQALEVF